MDNLVPWKSKTFQPGQRYGRYTILSLHKRSGTYQYLAKCQCDCGSEPHYIQPAMLKRGEASSCGCLHKERVTKHGTYQNPLYRVWRGMIERCEKPQNKRYPDYGGRGITVCEHWHDVKTFIADMIEGYQKGLQIDRIDNNKGYSKDNCHWTDRQTQCRNTRRNLLLTFQHQTKTLVEWSAIIGIPYGTIWERIKILGWTTERTLTTLSLDSNSRCRLARSARHSNKNLNDSANL